MIDFTALREYRRGLRPTQPESLPAFVDRELQQIAVILGEHRAALIELNDRVVALEP